MNFFDFRIFKKRRDFILDIEAQIPLGICGVFGHSGSGKTTLLHCLSGCLKPENGLISLREKFLFSSERKIDLPIQKRAIGMVFQEPLLFPHMTVYKNVLFGYTNRGLLDPEDVCAFLKINDILNAMPDQISGGQMQRVALARALCTEPQVLLMDEPVSALDKSARYEILSYIKDIYLKFSLPVLYVSHSLSEMVFLADHVVVLNKGKKTQQGPIDKILREVSQESDSYEDFENIFDVAVKAYDAGAGLCEVDWSGYRLRIPADFAQKERIGFSIKSSEIIVSRKPVEGISARNVVPAILKEIRAHKSKFVLYFVINDDKLCVVEITTGAMRQLDLKVNHQYFLIIKARSIRVLG